MKKRLYNCFGREKTLALFRHPLLLRAFTSVLLALICLGGSLGAISTQVSSEEMLPVIICFTEPPGTEEIALITDCGGEIIKIYHIVPAVSALIPADKVSQLLSDSRVKRIEEDITVSISSQQLPWGVDRIDADLVHPTNKGTGIKIAVLDTGIDLDHPDLSVAGNVSYVPGIPTGDDDNGHGTLVAGIIAALDNDTGVIGVAPEASLYAVKVLNEYGSGSIGAILSGIEWAVDNNMDIINMSLGSAANWPTTVIDALYNAYIGGIVIVAGAGNGGNPEGTGDNIWAPARYYPVIAVGATDSSDNRYSSSSTGSTLELMAPGVNIYSTAMGGGYGYISCTSASAPHAAGVAALLITDGMSDSINIRLRMRNTVEDLGDSGWDSKYGWGLVDAYQAINYSGSSDQTAPSTTISPSGTLGNSGWYISNVQVTLTATDNQGGSGVAETRYSLDGGNTWYIYSSPFTLSTNGTTQIKAKSWDNAGNEESAVIETVHIDKNAPVTTISPSGTPGNSGWYISDVQVTLTATDNEGGSGVSLTEYSLNNGETWNTYTSPFTLSTNGTTQILARATDIAGHTESPAVSQTVYIDKNAPVTTISPSGTPGNSGWYISDVQVTLTATDNQNGSGVSTTEYSLNNGQTWNTYTSPFTLSTNGTTQILARTTDVAGNTESPAASLEVKIDKTAPVTTISPSGTLGDSGWYRSNVQVTLISTDNQNGSGVSTTEYSLNNGQTWNTYTSPFTISTEGTTQILARATDIAGHTESPAASLEVKIDKTPPVLTESAVPQQIERLGKGRMVNVNYTGTAQDALSGIYAPTNTLLIDEYGQLNQDLGSNLSGTVAVEAWCEGWDNNGRTYTFRLTARDYAGNQAVAEAIVTVLHP